MVYVACLTVPLLANNNGAAVLSSEIGFVQRMLVRVEIVFDRLGEYVFL